MPAPDRFLSQRRAPRSAADLRIAVPQDKSGGVFHCDSLSEVKVYETVDEKRSVVKTMRFNANRPSEIAYIAQFEYPCVLSIEASTGDGDRRKLAVVMELMEKGSLEEN